MICFNKILVPVWSCRSNIKVFIYELNTNKLIIKSYVFVLHSDAFLSKKIDRIKQNPCVGQFTRSSYSGLEESSDTHTEHNQSVNRPSKMRGYTYMNFHGP